MVCVPIPLSKTPGRVAVPAARLTPAPPLSDDVVVPTVSVNVTEPVGIEEPLPAAVSLTVAAIVTAWPYVAGDGPASTTVDVESPAVRPVPLTETGSLDPSMFNALFVTVISVPTLPTDCGVNFTAISHPVPGASEVADVQGFVSAASSMKSAV